VVRDNARRFDRHDPGLGERSVNLPLDLGERLDLIPQGTRKIGSTGTK
jgi:hypothetical protein